MPNDPSTTLEPPAGAGLPARGSQPPSEPRTGDALIDAAAEGADLSTKESDDLLAYYLTNDGLPGDTDVTPLTVRLGNGKAARDFRAEVHTIEWTEWQDARERATDEKTGEFDAYVSASWIVARALVTPKLGPAVARAQQQNPETAPADGADLLRRMFRSQSGALLELSAKILELSKLQGNQGTVREVEAGKP